MHDFLERVEVLGLPVNVLSMDDAVQFVRRRIAQRNPARLVTINAEYVMLARHDSRFADVLRSADLATPDGAGVVWAMRRRGARQLERVGGSDLIWTLSRQAALSGYSIFLLGGAPGVAARAAEQLKRRYPSLRVAGSFPGSPSLAAEPYVVDLVRRSDADLLFVAFGAPQQDMWIARTLSRTGVYAAVGVGGSFDYVAGSARRAPPWMRERGLEWFWRLVRQPWRWRRMLALPRFAWLIMRERPPK
jgi:N-acetylglucosaminyldiphosphoundecaprenol N-acetyl-beta-D-mannosaminyltransferase